MLLSENSDDWRLLSAENFHCWLLQKADAGDSFHKC